MTMKQIKISEELKKELDNIKHENETYNNTIQKLLDGYRRLFIENQKLNYDKEILLKAIVNEKIDDNKYDYIPIIESVLYDNILTDKDRLNILKKYFSKEHNINFDDLLDCCGVVRDHHLSEDTKLLSVFERWITKNKQLK